MTTLKQTLLELKENSRLDDGINLHAIVQQMLAHIGDPDPDLRDGLIFTTFARWVDQDIIPPEQLPELLKTSLDSQHLFLGLGEKGTDTVFTRAFSSLLIAQILRKHRKGAFLEPVHIIDVLEKMSAYFEQERDARGFVGGKGWAHAIAHGADVLDELARCTELSTTQKLSILNTIQARAADTNAVYTHDEDERLAYAVLAVLEHSDLSEDDVHSWLNQFDSLAQQVGSYGLPDGYRGFVNLKNFLKTLYFELRRSDLAHSRQLQDHIEQLLERFSKL